MIDYESIYDDIREAGFMAGIVVHNGDIKGIEVDAPGIDAFDRTKKIMEIVGRDFKTVFFPNEGIIKIELK